MDVDISWISGTVTPFDKKSLHFGWVGALVTYFNITGRCMVALVYSTLVNSTYAQI